MLPTFAALTGQQTEAIDASDGVNVLPALTGDPAASIRDHLILAPRFGKNLAVRKGKWMYIGAQGDGGFGSNPNAHAAGGPGAVGFSGRKNSDIENGKIKEDAPLAQLYNLETDKAQTKNLYKEYPEIVREMEAILDTYIPKEERKDRR